MNSDSTTPGVKETREIRKRKHQQRKLKKYDTLTKTEKGKQAERERNTDAGMLKKKNNQLREIEKKSKGDI